MINPLGDLILIRRDRPGGNQGQAKDSLIIRPTSAWHDSKFCTVLKVGKGKRTPAGVLPSEVKEGDRVVVLPFDGIKDLPGGDPQLELVHESNIQCVVEGLPEQTEEELALADIGQAILDIQKGFDKALAGDLGIDRYLKSFDEGIQGRDA